LALRRSFQTRSSFSAEGPPQGSRDSFGKATAFSSSASALKAVTLPGRAIQPNCAPCRPVSFTGSCRVSRSIPSFVTLFQPIPPKNPLCKTEKFSCRLARQSKGVSCHPQMLARRCYVALGTSRSVFFFLFRSLLRPLGAHGEPFESWAISRSGSRPSLAFSRLLCYNHKQGRH